MIGGASLALLLTGGRSRRMRRDKALLDLDGRPLILTRLEQLRRHFAHCVVGCDPRRAMVADVPHWPDGEPGAGPLPALATALARWEAPIYLCAVDQPAPLRPILEAISAAHARDPQAAAWIAWCAGELQPLAGIYRESLAAPLAEARALGELSLRRFLEAREDVRRVDLPAMANLNDAAQLERWRQECDDVTDAEPFR